MKRDLLNRHATGLLVGFFVQFLDGMTVNLFITLPPTHPGTAGTNDFMRAAHSFAWAAGGGGGIALAIHVYIGIALLLGCIGLFVRGLRAHDQRWALAGLTAALFTIGAITHGLSFIIDSQAINSMVMAICWLIAVGALIVGLSRNFAIVRSNA